MMKKRNLALLAVACLMVFLVCSVGEATDFPKAKPIRLVVPYGAGGGVDISSREPLSRIEIEISYFRFSSISKFASL